MENGSESIGRRLFRARRYAGVSQTALAHRLGVTKQTISNRETGRVSISEDDLRKTALALGLAENTFTEPAPDAIPGPGAAANAFESLLKAVASQDPDLVLQFRAISEKADRLSPEDREFLAQMFRLALGRVSTAKDVTGRF